MSTTQALDIVDLGAQGDGIAKPEGRPVFVPYTLPGETVRAIVEDSRATLLSIETASPSRIEPVCVHFETCGGCALQHLALDEYRAWKVDILRQTLKHAGLDTACIQPGHFCEPYSRRRAVFSAIKSADGVVLGFQQAMSNQIIDLTECHVVTPAIDAARPHLKRLLDALLPSGLAVHVTVSDTPTGLDIAVDGKLTIGEKRKRTASDLVRQFGFPRLTVNGEVIIALRAPMVTFGKAEVSPPPGGFLQAVAAMEAVMAGLVSAHLKKAKKVADLFAGSGTFALRLAEKSTVHAVEGDAGSVAALDRGFREAAAAGLKPVTVERRDIYRRPMTAQDLKPYDGIVFDPPRAGAEALSKAIAEQPNITRVAAVSCNPETLARDLKVLVGGGFALKSVTPVDQFIWSPHLEAVALLERPKQRDRSWMRMR